MNRKHLKRYFGLIIGVPSVFLMILLIICSVSSTYALSMRDVDTVRKNVAIKVLAKNLQACYQNAEDSVIIDGHETYSIKDGVFWKDKDKEVFYPEKLYGMTGDKEKSTCAGLIDGWSTFFLWDWLSNRGGYVGVAQNVTLPNTAYDTVTYLEGVGYKPKDSNFLDGYKCFYFDLKIKYYEQEQSAFSSEIFCLKTKDIDNKTYVDPEYYPIIISEFGDILEQNGSGGGESPDLSGENYLPSRGDVEGIEVHFCSSPLGGGSCTFAFVENEDKGKVLIYNVWEVGLPSEYGTSEERPNDNKICGEGNDGMTMKINGIFFCGVRAEALLFDDFKDNYVNYVSKIPVQIENTNDFDYLFSTVTLKDVLSVGNEYTKTEGEEGEAKFVEYFFDQSGKEIVSSGYALDVAEQYMFYYDQLKDYFKSRSSTFEVDGGVKVFWLKDDGELEEKWLNENPETSGNKMCALTEDKSWDGGCDSQKDWKYFAKELENFKKDDLMGAFEDVEVLDDDYGNDENGRGNKVCYKDSGALGWLICPIVQAAYGVGQHMWNVVEKHLEVPAEAIFISNDGVRKAWEVVRDIANVAFIILFMFVIFSQLTGIGIDNYGIKKILPKLIMTAVLINLSYIICELAVDASNILGKGLNSLLSNWASGMAGQGSSLARIIGGWTVTALFAAGSAAVIFDLFPLAILSAGLAVLGFLISLVVSMFFLYLTLVTREAAVILAIVVSPVALVCNMLPNTEKLYKKWFDIFKAVLVVYPLCGALVGAGQMAGAILSNIEGMGVAAMLVQVIPFFLIPSLLRSSLSALGNVGAKLHTMGQSFGRKTSSTVKNGIRNTDQVKDWSKHQQELHAERRARRIHDRLSGRTGLSRRQTALLAQANQTLLASEKKQKQDNVDADNDQFSAASRKQGLEVDEAAKDTLLYNDTAYVEGKRGQGKLRRQDDLEGTRLYSRADYVAAKQTESDVRREDELEGALHYNDTAYVEGKRGQNSFKQDEELKATKLYSDAAFVEAKKTESGIRRQGEVENTMNYNDPNYIIGKERQVTQRSKDELEDTKLFADDDYFAVQNLKAENARMERKGEGIAGVYAITEQEAIDRAKARKETQEERALQDKFARFTPEQLLAEGGYDKVLDVYKDVNLNWTGSTDEKQRRMSALIRAMLSRGMDKEVSNVIEANDIGNNDSAMQALMGAKDYVLRAYAKKGAGKNFIDFKISGLESYINGNGLSGVDDDSLEQIIQAGLTTHIRPEMIMKSALTEEVPKVRNKMNEIIAKQIGTLADDSSFDDNMRKFGLTSQSFASMNDDTAVAIRRALMGALSLNETNPGDVAMANTRLRTIFASQIAGANADSQIKARVSSGVREIFGIS